MNNKLKIKIGKEEHGWLPFEVKVGSNTLHIDASDVPVDPVDQLISAVEKCFVHNFQSEAYMHLEPNYYKWVFTPDVDRVKLDIVYIEEVNSLTTPGNKEKKQEIKLTYESGAEELMTLMWRAIKEYLTRENGSADNLSLIERKLNALKSKG